MAHVSVWAIMRTNSWSIPWLHECLRSNVSQTVFKTSCHILIWCQSPLMWIWGYFFRICLETIGSNGWYHKSHPESKVNGANMGTTWLLSAPDGPHVGPMNLAIRAGYTISCCYKYVCAWTDCDVTVCRALLTPCMMALLRILVTCIMLISDLWTYPDSKVHRANMGPIWGRQDPAGPHVGPINLAIWVCLCVCLCTRAFRKTNMYHHGVEIIKSKVTNMLVPIYLYCRQLYDIVLWRWRKPFRRWWSPILTKQKGRIILSSHALLHNHW